MNAKVLTELNSYSKLVNKVLLESETIEEAKAVIKKVVRNGEIKPITTCPEGYHLGMNGKCEKTSPAQAMAFKKRGQKAAKSRGKVNSNVFKSREKSMKIRKSKPSNFWKETSAK